MNTIFNLLRVPFQSNLQRLTSFSTVSKLSPLSSSITKGTILGRFQESVTPTLKHNGLLSQKSSQLIVPNQISNSISFRGLHVLARNGNETLTNTLNSAYNKVSLSGVFSFRTIIRENFAKPNELKRIRKHGWKKRISTKSGREIIMRRILKGRHCLTH